MNGYQADHSSEQIARQIAANLEKGMEMGIFPGGISSLTVAGHSPIVVARGKLAAPGYEGEREQVQEDTIYDLASLTKVVVTLPLVLLSVQTGKLSLSDSIVTHLPELKTGRDSEAKQRITLFHLLTHTSGFPAWRPFYLRSRGKEAYLQMIAEEELLSNPDEQVVYSDLGFMLLGFILERVWEEQLDRLAHEQIFAPCNMTMTTYRPLTEMAQLSSKVAPTEYGNVYERGMVLHDNRYEHLHEQLDAFGWRQQMIRATVHDGNAYYGLQGVSGHAGLFSTISDLQRYMQLWTDDSASFLDPVLRDFAVRSHCDSLAPARAVGWEASSTGGANAQVAAGCSGGDLISAFAFGHTGFTGTSIWHDPARKATMITLTNRVHPAPSDQIKQWRKTHHNRIFALAPR